MSEIAPNTRRERDPKTPPLRPDVERLRMVAGKGSCVDCNYPAQRSRSDCPCCGGVVAVSVDVREANDLCDWIDHLQRELDGTMSVLRRCREVLCQHGHCDDGELPVMIDYAIRSATQRGRDQAEAESTD